MKYSVKSQLGQGRAVMVEGCTCASFANSDDGRAAYVAFVKGLGHGDSLYNEDTQQTIIGTLGAMMAEDEAVMGSPTTLGDLKRAGAMKNQNARLSPDALRELGIFRNL